MFFLLLVGLLAPLVSPSFLVNWAILQEQLIFMDQDPGVSEICRDQSQIFRSGLNLPNLTAPSLTMLDASGKLPAGMGQGNLYSLGSYEECVGIVFDMLGEKEDFRGRYCKGSIRFQQHQEEEGQEKDVMDKEEEEDDVMDSVAGVVFSSYRGLTWGVCVPEGCSASDIKTHVDGVLGEVGGDLGRLYSRFYDDDCYMEKQEVTFDTLDIVFTALMSLVAFIVILATCKDVIKRYSPFWLGKDKREFSTINESGLARVLGAFSIYRNGAKLFNTTESKRSIRCLHGLRFFSMTWVIFGHGAFNLFFYNTSASWSSVGQFSEKWGLEVLFNAYPSVDTFLFLSGFLLAYSLLPEFDRREGSKVAVIPSIVVHRYLRLTPAYLVVIGFLATIRNKVFVFGPNDKNAHSESCRDIWWKMILYIHTMFDGTVYEDDHKGSCMAQAWYLSLDMQLFLFSLPLTFLIWFLATRAGWKVASLVAGLVTFIALLVPGILTVVFDFAPTDVIQHDREGVTLSQHDIIYKKPWCRAMPYLLGIWLAFWLWSRKDSKPLVLSRVTVTVGWVLAVTCGLLVEYGMYPYNQPGPATWSTATAFFYSTFHRPVWSLCLAWVVVACHHGYGGPINNFLGWSAFTPLSRLTYSSYLVHFVVLDLIWDNMRVMHKDLLVLSWIHIGVVVVSMSFAVVLALMVEMPASNLDNILLGRQKREKGNKIKQEEKNKV